MAEGDTIVLVIMKKMSSRKMMSVMDDMLNVGVTLVLRCNAIVLYVQKVHEGEALTLKFVDYTIDFCHQVIVGK